MTDPAGAQGQGECRTGQDVARDLTMRPEPVGKRVTARITLQPDPNAAAHATGADQLGWR